MLVEMTIKSLMVDPITNMPIVVLREHEGERVLPIWVGIFEANAIAIQIENIETPRPMTHDLIRNMLIDLNAHVDKIVIANLKGKTFYASIHIRVDGEDIAIDSRPSDAIAVALRVRAPILVDEDVIENAKTIEFTPDKANSEQLSKWLEGLPVEELGKYKM
tara:strand:+ start:933 stop:1418 length:486 start_codon:yes stop_codon:yes gene_type:complete